MTGWTNPVNDSVIECEGAQPATQSDRTPLSAIYQEFCLDSCLIHLFFLKETRHQSCCSCLAPHPCITGMDFDTHKSSLRKRAAASPPSTWGERTWIQRDGSSADSRKKTGRIFLSPQFQKFFWSSSRKTQDLQRLQDVIHRASPGKFEALLSPEPVAQRLMVRVLFSLSEGIQSGGCFGHFMSRIWVCDSVE